MLFRISELVCLTEALRTGKVGNLSSVYSVHHPKHYVMGEKTRHTNTAWVEHQPAVANPRAVTTTAQS